jgi:hypothetical protein
MTIRGSCHCGNVAYSLKAEPPREAMECNCSICRRKGYLHWFVDPAAFTLDTPREALAAYTFGKRLIRHQFCRTCGCAPFIEGTPPGGGKPVVSVNLRCTDLDLPALTIKPFDGASL